MLASTVDEDHRWRRQIISVLGAEPEGEPLWHLLPTIPVRDYATGINADDDRECWAYSFLVAVARVAGFSTTDAYTVARDVISDVVASRPRAASRRRRVSRPRRVPRPTEPTSVALAALPATP